MIGGKDFDSRGEGIRAVSTEKGLVVTFNRKALLHLKSGGTSSINLVSGNGTLGLKFMRDSTYKRQEHQLKKLAEDANAHQQDIEGLAEELAK